MRAFLYRVGTAVRAVRELFERSVAARWLFGLSFVLVILTAFLPFWKVFPNAMPGQFIPLHADIYFGVDQFGPWWQLFTPAALGLALLLVNTGVGAACYRKERVVTWFFLGLMVFIEIVLLVASAFMVLLNI